MRMIQLTAAVAAALVASIDEAGSVTGAMAQARDDILREFADRGLNRAGEPIEHDAPGIESEPGLADAVAAADADLTAQGSEFEPLSDAEPDLTAGGTVTAPGDDPGAPDAYA